ncbi:DUF6691 family protein [uncultured Litoreibacter sp.]|uniref:DUF6691 family protein n=1 Tax=uncultured Litoreibacter sp. TaxID=1392394 RepID=UPI0026064B5C|nr:DUF6691 family protein [uncultured Litoreibacter sp.]
MRGLIAVAAGGLFGMGLLTSGMTDTTKVQGWLDLFGAWDPTLAFVLGGAIVPMAIAWRIAAKRRDAVLGGVIPAQPDAQITPRLAVGSALFGVGWGLSGLCPGPAMASLGFGGWQGFVFFIAMCAAMMAQPRVTAAFARGS